MRNRPLTILETTHAGIPAGSTFVIQNLSERLAARGHRVLVGCRAGTVLAARAHAAGLEVVPMDFERVGPLARALEELMMRENVDLVNSHESRDRRALTWLRWQGRLPQAFVVTRHTMPLTLPPELVAIGLTADRTIAVSRAVAGALKRRLHPRGRLRVVENGIDIAKVDAPPSPAARAEATAALAGCEGLPVIVILARRKDQHILLNSLALVKRPVAVACVGIEPDRRLSGIPIPSRHRVVYVPFTDHPLMYYRLASVAALPSRIEGLSLSLLEAMATGLPVIASDAGGNRDLITPNETGLLIPPLRPDAWANAIERVLGDTAFAARIGRAGQEVVRRERTLERATQQTEAVYWEAMAFRLALERTPR